MDQDRIPVVTRDRSRSDRRARCRLTVVALTVFATACSVDRPVDLSVERNLDAIFSEVLFLNNGDIDAAGRSNDARVAWPLVDLLRFHEGQTKAPALIGALRRLTGVRVPDRDVAWVEYTQLLIQRGIDAPPGYFRWKRAMFVGFHERWAPFFDADAGLDWRHVTWGGVLRDGIKALVDPPVAAATNGAWLPDEEVVFAVRVNGHTRAYPQRVMEVHELVNDSIGGRRIALSYCTLCGSAVANVVEDVEGRTLEMRTSGLLQRSNKLMYDAQTESLFDQFSGTAVTGLMKRAGVTLARVPVAVARWGEWRRTHPETTITAEEIDGRSYGPDPLQGRDDDGPIFPVGPVDRRLPAMTEVFGVTTPDGAAVAFPMARAREALASRPAITAHGVEVRSVGGALEVRSADGPTLIGQRAFWFAWAQFHPRTLLWEG